MNDTQSLFMKYFEKFGELYPLGFLTEKNEMTVEEMAKDIEKCIETNTPKEVPDIEYEYGIDY